MPYGSRSLNKINQYRAKEHPSGLLRPTVAVSLKKEREWEEAVLIAMGAKVVETAPFYIYGTFIVSYATSNLSFNESEALHAVVIGSLVATILIPIIGHLLDRIGRKRIYLFGIVATVLYDFPYFWMLQQGSVFFLILATVIGLGFIWGSLNAVQGTMMSESRRRGGTWCQRKRR
ncbi:hypothetical protein BTM36_23150 [Herbaspirillum sp. VT-16-41]|nr:hypothetical protein BTM36_23150 [Herbaspirillum sp. VT-16-41]